MKLLAFAASLRKESLNRKLINVAIDLAKQAGAEVDWAEFREFDMPIYDGDLEAKEGLPKGAAALVRRIEAADGIMLASPEYNFSVPGTIKNAIDWASRARPIPFRGKSVCLMSASPSRIGGNRGLWHLRVPLEALGAIVHPDMFSLPVAHEAFAEDGTFRDDQNTARLRETIFAYVKMAKALAV